MASGHGHYLICQDVPGHLNPVCAMEDQSPLAESDAAGIVAAVRTYRAMLSEDAVEAVARVIKPGAYEADQRAMDYQHHDWTAAVGTARAVIECLLARGEGG